MRTTLVDITKLRFSKNNLPENQLEICLECGERLQKAIDGEIVCKKYGRVWGL